MKPIDTAIEILQKTQDGNDLTPEHLSLVQSAVNGWLSEAGEVAFYELEQNVENGYKKPWLHGIEHLTRDHEGYVYWKGRHVEHYDAPWVCSQEGKEQAEEVARRCSIIEARGETPTTLSVIWRWDERKMNNGT